MDTVYIVQKVIIDHNDWSGDYECIDKVFASYESAVKYLSVNGCVKDVSVKNGEGRWDAPKYVCKMNNIDCLDCPHYDPENDDDVCDEWDDRFEDENCTTYYRLVPHVLVR